MTFETYGILFAIYNLYMLYNKMNNTDQELSNKYFSIIYLLWSQLFMFIVYDKLQKYINFNKIESVLYCCLLYIIISIACYIMVSLCGISIVELLNYYK